MASTVNTQEKIAYLRISHLAHVGWLSRCLHAITRLGVADVIGEHPQSYENVAQAVGVNPRALRTVLRCLASNGVFTDFGSTIEHNESSRLLANDHPLALASVVKWAGSPVQWAAFGALENVLLTGQAALGPDGLFGALAAAPAEAAAFDHAMEAVTLLQSEALAAAYDFSHFGTICDVGGGRGHLLSTILAIAPEANGILLDLRGVIERLGPPKSRRIEYVSCDLLNEMPPPADAYVLKNVLHDWADHQCVRILRNIRSIAPPASEIIIAETVLADTFSATSALMVDLGMLVLNGGQERTLHDFNVILEQASLKLNEVVFVNPALSLIISRVSNTDS
jgi:hypothetical protein